MYFRALAGLFIVKKGKQVAALVREEKVVCCVGTSRPVQHMLLWHRQDPSPQLLLRPCSIAAPSSSRSHPLLLLDPSIPGGKPGKHPTQTYLPSGGCEGRRFLFQCVAAQHWLLKQNYVGSEGRRESLRLEHLPPENPSSFFFVLLQASCVIAEMLFDLSLHL